jgi:20S proteasome alpha/beta subunit
LNLLPPKKPFHAPVKHKQYARSMTIAIGLLTQDGIILGADSQESYGNDRKTRTGKISLYASGSATPDGLGFRSIAVTGAGDSGYLAVVRQRIYDALETCSEIEQVQTILEGVIEDFWERHVFIIPQWNEFDVQLIVAASLHGKRGLWLTYLNTVRRVHSFAAVGTGEEWATSVLRGFVPDLTTERTGAIVAAYAVFAAKEHSKECGKETLIVSIPQIGLGHLADMNAIQKIEDCFNRYEWAERARRWRTFGTTPSGAMGAEFFQELETEMAGIDPFPVPTWAKGQSSNPTTSESSQA